MKSYTAITTTGKLLFFSLSIPSSLLFCLLLSSLATHITPKPPDLQLHLTVTLSSPPPPPTAIINFSFPAPPTPLPLPTHFPEPSAEADNVQSLYRSLTLTSPPPPHPTTPNVSFPAPPTPLPPPTHFPEPSSKAENVQVCDVYHGKWVFDQTYPLYRSCFFVDEGFNCQANGRPDAEYMKWRWQPHGCTVPRFNPVRMLEMLRGKRLVFVGDSINRNQWESMLCLLSSVIRNPNRVREARGQKITKERGNYSFKFLDYDCSVEYYVSHYLVHEGKGRVGKKRAKTLRIDRIDRSSSRWRGADILVFNTAHWWSHYKTKSGVNYYQEGDQIHPRLDVSVAFRKALMTWALWVDRHAAPRKTQVFFRSSSPSHFRGGEWNSGGHCKESSLPLNGTYFRPDSENTVILEQVVRQMRTHVTILNITRLSGLRIDAHPSIYGGKKGRGTPVSIEDCSHWCLPGLPDIWNELLYFNLLSTQTLV